TADGRMLATGHRDMTLRLWEVPTGRERGRIAGHEAPVFSVDFAPAGNRLLAAASNDAVYVWDVYATVKPQLAGAKLSKEDRDKLWQRLADADSTVAFQAMGELMA